MPVSSALRQRFRNWAKSARPMLRRRARAMRLARALARPVRRRLRATFGRFRRGGTTASSIGGNYSRYARVTRRRPRLSRALAVNSWFLTQQTSITATPGRQNSIVWYALDGGSYGGGSALDTIRQLCPTASVGENKTTRYFIKSLSERYLLTNATNAPCELTIYDIVTRRDSLYNPQTCWADGLTNVQGATINITRDTPACTPYMSPEFTKFFKVVRQKRVILSGGATHIHQKYVRRPIYIDMQCVYAFGTQNLVALRGKTMFTLIVVSGIAANDSTDKTQIETSQAKINMVLRQVYSYQWVDDNHYSMLGTTTMATGFTNNQSIIQPASGTLQTGVVTA